MTPASGYFIQVCFNSFYVPENISGKPIWDKGDTSKGLLEKLFVVGMRLRSLIL